MRSVIAWLMPVTFLLGCSDSESAGQISANAPKIQIEQYVNGLDRPILFTHDGTDRQFIVEQPGRIRLVRNGKMEVTPYLNIWKQVISQMECGLLSVAFHPKFAENGLMYVNYTTRAPRLVSRISEFKADPKADVVDPQTERVLLTLEQPFPNHNGGMMAFGPDGMLYCCFGDGGSMNDPYNNGQNMQTWLGKIIRIDVDHKDEGKEYAIPKDNPFVNDPNYLPEIYASGLRNAWRFSFDRVTGLLYAADVGQNLWEEINIIEKGGNYGWRIRESMHDFEPVPNPPKMIDPIKEYHHDLGLSVTGGYVYRGKKIPALIGWYVYADYATGRVWGLKYENGKITDEAQILQIRGQAASFGEDVDGEMYLCDHAGFVFRIVAAN